MPSGALLAQREGAKNKKIMIRGNIKFFIADNCTFRGSLGQGCLMRINNFGKIKAKNEF